MHEKVRRAMILEPGNLLDMARLTFRVKCNNQFWGFRSPGMLSAFVMKAGIFYGMRLFIMNYTRLNGRRYYFGYVRFLRALMNGFISTPK